MVSKAQRHAGRSCDQSEYDPDVPPWATCSKKSSSSDWLAVLIDMKIRSAFYPVLHLNPVDWYMSGCRETELYVLVSNFDYHYFYSAVVDADRFIDLSLQK